MLSQIITFLKTCPLLKNLQITTDLLLDQEETLCVLREDCEPVLYRYTDGGSLRQFEFKLTSRETSETKAEELYDGLAAWVEKTKNDLPLLEKGQLAQKIEILRRAGVEDTTYSGLRYGMNCRLIYYQEE